jgi:hypothetical protein
MQIAPFAMSMARTRRTIARHARNAIEFVRVALRIFFRLIGNADEMQISCDSSLSASCALHAQWTLRNRSRLLSKCEAIPPVKHAKKNFVQMPKKCVPNLRFRSESSESPESIRTYAAPRSRSRAPAITPDNTLAFDNDVAG